jgi:hypothetical protein
MNLVAYSLKPFAMLEKGFLHDQNSGNTKHSQVVLKANQVLRLLGVLALAGPFIYLLITWRKSDALIAKLMPFMVAGLGMISVSYFIRRAFSKLHR